MKKTLGTLAVVGNLFASEGQAHGTNLLGITQNPETVYYLEKPSTQELTAAISSGASCDFQAIRDTQGNSISAVPKDIEEAVDQAQKEIVWICSQK